MSILLILLCKTPIYNFESIQIWKKIKLEPFCMKFFMQTHRMKSKFKKLKVYQSKHDNSSICIL